MQRLYLAFLRGVSANITSRIGVILTTSSVVVFILFEIIWWMGILTNAYIGLVTYVALPSAFLLGLALIPMGWWRYSKIKGKKFSDLFSAQFSDEDFKARVEGSRVLRIVTILTLANVIFLGVLSTQTVHFMDSSRFCGTACHAVMSPEWTTYQVSPHAHVKCVECHVGEGTRALINSKLNGAWQMISASFNLYEQPIPTPVHNLRPARETCEHCHWPDKFHGNRIVTHEKFEQNELNTRLYTTLMLKIGTGADGKASGSHWHVGEDNEVRYSSVDDQRKEIIWVEVLQENGNYKRYNNSRMRDSNVSGSEHVRVLDCVDCHNRATHIYEDPERALDDRLEHGLISASLPFIKQKGLGALLGSYPDKESGLKSIDLSLRNYYLTNYPDISNRNTQSIDQAISTIQEIYSRNIHPEMNITWNSYPSQLGHRGDQGCFRCHNSYMVDDDGKSISMDCTLCHSILAVDSQEPFDYLNRTSLSDSNAVSKMKMYLGEEFRSNIRK